MGWNVSHKPIEVVCWGCSTRLLDESEREWADGLSGAHRAQFPVLMAGEIGDHPYCLLCLKSEEAVAKYERIKRQQEARKRDPATLRKVNCARCDCLLLGDVERPWAALLPKEVRLAYEPFPDAYVCERPYCQTCLPIILMPPEAVVEDFEDDLPPWEEIRKRLHL